jgi:hypothetical protein
MTISNKNKDVLGHWPIFPENEGERLNDLIKIFLLIFFFFPHIFSPILKPYL